MVQFLRLVTVHPALVHFSLGTVPVLLLAYAMAARRRSEGWTLAGDATLVVTALITLATAGFGIVSFVALEWPGGLGLWRWLHLATGAASTVALVAFAVARLRRRRRARVSGIGAFGASLATGALLLATGWVGGEVLVFRSGMAVTAAGDGAYAPPITRQDAPPDDLDDAMARIRADWGAIHAATGAMIVERPSAESFRRVAEHARSLRDAAAWVSRADERGSGPRTARAGAPLRVAILGPMSPRGGSATSAGSRREHLAAMGSALEARANALVRAAMSRDLAELSQNLGATGALCASCHQELRWNH